jgi:acyl-CoA synthetase (AMP-forming)/AMP-acid ligase II
LASFDDMPDVRAAARLLGSLAARPERAALEFEERIYSFRDLERLSARFAAGLAAFGVTPGDAVAVRMPTCPEAVVAFLGDLRAGAVHVPLNPDFGEEESRHIVTDSGSKLTVAHTAGDCPYGKQVAFEDVLAAGAPAPSARDGAEDDATALLLYTSGTTGKSKGVELSFRAVVSNLGGVTGLWRIGPADRVAIALPLFHVHGLGLGVIGSLLNGATVLLFRKFDTPAIVEAFRTHGATVFMGVPTMYVRLLEHLRADPKAALALSKGRLFTSGSAPLRAADFESFREATGHAVLERYGMTETLFTLSNPYDGERRPGSVGLPVPRCHARIVDDAGRDVGPGETGELVVKGDGLMTRYRNRPEETAASFRDGWFLTGDAASRAPDGYVTLHGRKAVDFVKSGGYRISAREIEDVLARHPSVAEVAVVGLPDRVWGERVTAVVRCAAGADRAGLPDELRRLAAASLAAYKQPRDIVLVDDFPRTPLGKIRKTALGSALAKGA